MMRVNSNLTVVDKIDDDPIRSVSHKMQADDIGDVSIWAWWLWQSAEKRCDIVKIFDASESNGC